eukprot:scaffold80014_cov20-Prasinocladus_malaysianus.AAC.1
MAGCTLSVLQAGAPSAVAALAAPFDGDNIQQKPGKVLPRPGDAACDETMHDLHDSNNPSVILHEADEKVVNGSEKSVKSDNHQETDRLGDSSVDANIQGLIISDAKQDVHEINGFAKAPFSGPTPPSDSGQKAPETGNSHDAIYEQFCR